MAENQVVESAATPVAIIKCECGVNLLEGWKACPMCGKPVPATTCKCGAKYPDGARFCPVCGCPRDGGSNGALDQAKQQDAAEIHDRALAASWRADLPAKIVECLSGLDGFEQAVKFPVTGASEKANARPTLYAGFVAFTLGTDGKPVDVRLLARREATPAGHMLLQVNIVGEVDSRVAARQQRDRSTRR